LNARRVVADRNLKPKEKPALLGSGLAKKAGLAGAFYFASESGLFSGAGLLSGAG
jgi:hypothetical protein